MTYLDVILLFHSNRNNSVRVKIEKESWVFISAYEPGSEKSEVEIEEFWNE